MHVSRISRPAILLSFALTAFSGEEWKKVMKSAKAAGLTPEDYIKAAALK
jgi:hypothetical protein